MANVTRIAAALLILVSLVLAMGCGGGGSSVSSPSASPDFSITVQPTSLNLVLGTSTQFHITLLPQNGFNGTVSVNFNSLPSGVSTSPALPQNVGVSGVDLIVSAASNAPAGSYSLQLMATGGNLQHSVNVPLRIGNRANISILVPSQIVNVPTGGNSSVAVDINTDSGIVDYSVQLQASVRSGVTATFSNATIVPPVQITLTLTANTNTSAGPGTVNVQAIRSVDGVPVSNGFPIYVDPPPGTIPGNRTTWVRTGSNPIATYYDAPRNRVLVGIPAQSRLDVIDPTTGTVASSIPVSLAGYEPNGVWLASSSNLSSSLDRNSLYALGSGQLSTIDLASSQVVSRRPLPQYIPVGWTTPVFTNPGFLVAAANGRFVMATWGDFDVYNWDGTSPLASLHTISDVYSLDRNYDGTQVLIASGDTSGGYYLLDVASDTITKQGAYSNAVIMTVRGNPVRNEWAVANSNGIDFFDANLSLVASLPAALFGSYWGMAYSSDGKYLYFVYNPSGLPFLVTVDAVAHTVVRIAPATGTDLAYYRRDPPEFMPQPTSADTSGLVFELGEKGLVIDDSTYSVNPLYATPAYWAIIATPDAGLVNALTSVQITTQSYNALPDVWFGSQRAKSASLSNAGQVTTTAPAVQSPGPVNIKLFPPDGYAHLMPQAFTYGTVLTSVRNSVCGPSGGCSADIFGFGLAGTNSAQVSVKIGGNSASLQGVHYFNVDQPYPYPLQYVTVTVPPGIPGRADITVSTNVGNATLPGAFLYAKSVQSFPSSPAYNSMLYDDSRGILYASTNTGIARYSVSSASFLTPLTPPTLTGQSQFEGMALTPDDSKLLVTNLVDVSAAVIDLNNPSNAAVVAVPAIGYPAGPTSVAATSTGKAFICMQGLPIGTPYIGPLLEMDLATMKVTPRSDPNVSIVRDPALLSATSGGSKVLVRGYGGPVVVWDAVSDGFSPVDDAFPGAAVGAAAGDGNVFAVGQGFVDTNLNALIAQAIPDVLASRFGGIGGSFPTNAAVNDSGSLSFVPHSRYLEIFDTQHGNVLQNITLPNQMNIWFQVIAIDKPAHHVFLSDSQGLTVYEFAAAPLAIGSVTPATVTSGGSAVVRVRGSGFQVGTVVTIGGKVAPAVLVDVNTLQVTTPANPIGPAQMIVQSPDGESYKLDAALLYQ